MGIDLPPDLRARLLGLLGELSRWNRAYNLTAITDPEQMVIRHLLDSLSVLPWMDAAATAPLLDVGSGPGLPGLVLAACQPRRPCVLLDRVAKKLRFVVHAAGIMGLSNVEPVHARVEDHRPVHPGGYPTVIARAFAPPTRLLALCRHAVAPGGRVLAMASAVAPAELAGCERLGWRAQMHCLEVPGIAERRLLVLFPPS